MTENFAVMDEAAGQLAKASQIICTGVGKSGYVAMKMAASLISVGRPAAYLDPVGALHGDLGMIQDGAVVLAFSKSGASSELEAIMPHLKRRNVLLIALCNRPGSRLGLAANIFIPLSVDQEGDRHNMLPLISTDISLIQANMLVARVAECTGLDPGRLALNHPGGQLGRNTGLLLRDLEDWPQRKPFVLAGTPLLEAIITDSEHRAGLVCVVDKTSKLTGIVTDGDIRASLRQQADTGQVLIDALINQTPVVLNPDLSVGDALRIMERPSRRVFSAPVLEHDICLGVVTLHDLLSNGRPAT